MAVVINDFEVMPQTPSENDQKSGKKADDKGGQKNDMSDQDVKKMLEHCAERMERIAAH